MNPAVLGHISRQSIPPATLQHVLALVLRRQSHAFALQAPSWADEYDPPPPQRSSAIPEYHDEWHAPIPLAQPISNVSEAVASLKAKRNKRSARELPDLSALLEEINLKAVGGKVQYDPRNRKTRRVRALLRNRTSIEKLWREVSSRLKAQALLGNPADSAPQIESLLPSILAILRLYVACNRSDWLIGFWRSLRDVTPVLPLEAHFAYAEALALTGQLETAFAVLETLDRPRHTRNIRRWIGECHESGRYTVQSVETGTTGSFEGEPISYDDEPPILQAEGSSDAIRRAQESELEPGERHSSPTHAVEDPVRGLIELTRVAGRHNIPSKVPIGPIFVREFEQASVDIDQLAKSSIYKLFVELQMDAWLAMNVRRPDPDGTPIPAASPVLPAVPDTAHPETPIIQTGSDPDGPRQLLGKLYLLYASTFLRLAGIHTMKDGLRVKQLCKDFETATALRIELRTNYPRRWKGARTAFAQYAPRFSSAENAKLFGFDISSYEAWRAEPKWRRINSSIAVRRVREYERDLGRLVDVVRTADGRHRAVIIDPRVRMRRQEEQKIVPGEMLKARQADLVAKWKIRLAFYRYKRRWEARKDASAREPSAMMTLLRSFARSVAPGRAGRLLRKARQLQMRLARRQALPKGARAPWTEESRKDWKLKGKTAVAAGKKITAAPSMDFVQVKEEELEPASTSTVTQDAVEPEAAVVLDEAGEAIPTPTTIDPGLVESEVEKPAAMLTQDAVEPAVLTGPEAATESTPTTTAEPAQVRGEELVPALTLTVARDTVGPEPERSVIPVKDVLVAAEGVPRWTRAPLTRELASAMKKWKPRLSQSTRDRSSSASGRMVEGRMYPAPITNQTTPEPANPVEPEEAMEDATGTAPTIRDFSKSGEESAPASTVPQVVVSENLIGLKQEGQETATPMTTEPDRVGGKEVNPAPTVTQNAIQPDDRVAREEAGQDSTAPMTVAPGPLEEEVEAASAVTQDVVEPTGSTESTTEPQVANRNYPRWTPEPLDGNLAKAMKKWQPRPPSETMEANWAEDEWTDDEGRELPEKARRAG